MPMRRLLPPRASSGRWRSMVVTLAMVAVGQLLLWCLPSTTPPISSKLALIWRGAPAFSLACKSTVVVGTSLGRSRGFVSADREVDHQLWRGSCATCGRRTVFLNSPWLLRTGWWSFFNLLAMEPKRRLYLFFSRSVAWCHGGLAAPSGLVPGGNGAELVGKKIGTRLRFFSASWGPLCKNQGPACNFLLSVGLVVRCVVLSFFYY